MDVRLFVLPSSLSLASAARRHRPQAWILLTSSDVYRYEMRRQCQEILPGVLLGPLQVSKSLDTLKSLNITHMSVLSRFILNAC